MSIQKSSSWSNNEDYVDNIDKGESYLEEEEIIDGFDISVRLDNVPTEVEEIKPLFNKNLYLDKDMYNRFLKSKGNKIERLKYISTTSEIEDKKFNKTALVFILVLFLVSLIVGLSKYNNPSGLISSIMSSGKYVLALVITFYIFKRNSKYKERLSDEVIDE